MNGLRQILMTRPWLALWLVTLALALKIAMPAGYMVRQEGTVLTIAICGDASATHLVRQIVVPQRETPQDTQAQHAKSAACPYSVLAMAGAAGADPLLLAEALAFILAVGLALRTAPAPTRHAHLRPPLRGPPRVV
jgi:hypothetical protein